MRAFAAQGYEGMSLRALNAELGLSSGTINQRFSSKERLWYAAVDFGFRHMIADMNTELQRLLSDDDLTLAHNTIRAFRVASWKHAELVRLMNQEGLHSTDRLDHVVTTFILPTLSVLTAAMDRLADAGVLRRVPARALLFLLAHGAAAPFTLRALSDWFDPIDGPLEPACHVDLTTEVIMAGLRNPDPGTS